MVAAAPAAGSLMVRYAALEDGASTTTHGGTVAGFRGQLRDSDPFVGYDAQTIRCAVTTGSAAVTCPASNALALRSVHDDVDGAGLVEGTTVLTTDRLTHATPSARWTGPSGTVALRFRAPTSGTTACTSSCRSRNDGSARRDGAAQPR